MSAPTRLLLLPILTSLVSTVTAVEFNWEWDQNHTSNQTHARERAEIIPSIYGDVRRPLMEVMPAYPMPTWASNLSLTYEWSKVAWAANAPMAQRLSDPVAADPNKPYLQQRSDLGLHWSGMTGWTWLGYEFELPISYAAPAYASDRPSLGEFAYRALIPLSTTRYSAVTLVLGASTMIPTQDTDPLISHGWVTPQIGLRATSSLGMVVFTADAMAFWSPIAQWDPQDKAIDHTLDHDYRAMTGSLAVTWRPLRWLRAGVVQRYEQHLWGDRVIGSGSGGSSSVDMRLISAPTMLVIEGTPVRNVNISIEVGADLLSNSNYLDSSLHNRMDTLPVFGLSFTTIF